MERSELKQLRIFFLSDKWKYESFEVAERKIEGAYVWWLHIFSEGQYEGKGL